MLTILVSVMGLCAVKGVMIGTRIKWIRGSRRKWKLWVLGMGISVQVGMKVCNVGGII